MTFCYFFADDVQVYLHFRDSLKPLLAYLWDVATWMDSNYLNLNTKRIRGQSVNKTCRWAYAASYGQSLPSFQRPGLNLYSSDKETRMVLSISGGHFHRIHSFHRVIWLKTKQQEMRLVDPPLWPNLPICAWNQTVEKRKHKVCQRWKCLSVYK